MRKKCANALVGATGVIGEGAHQRTRRGTLGSPNDNAQGGSLSMKALTESITSMSSNWMAEQSVVAMKWGNSHGAKGLYLNYIFNKTRRSAWIQKTPLRNGCRRALRLKTACRLKSHYCDGNWAIKPNKSRNFDFMHCMIESTEWMY